LEARKIFAVAASVFILAACGTPEPPPKQVAPPRFSLSNENDVAGAILIRRDEPKKTTHYTGPNAASRPTDKMFMRAWKQDHGRPTYQIYVEIGYTGTWRLFNWAYDPYGNTLDTTLLTRDLKDCKSKGCRHNESIGVDVTGEYLEQNQQSGIRFWVSGKAAGEDVPFFIPAGYVRAFLAATR